MKKLQKQAGFTLIELVIVIVILGILAATAAPKFIDLTGDAKTSVIEGVKGALNSAADLAHAKALIAGKISAESAGQAISVGSSNILLNFGWPTNASIADLIDIDGGLSEVSTSPGTFQHDDATTTSTCIATYNNTATNAETRPTVEATTGGC
ncbi:prepilin-type N-terminal cleavage/methylation domain-containing protein [Colwellia sp. MB02u-14]|uniref:prepilin-type N-terminal cleavage/methylation domain-containing protein n=1 Tax=Colwellia sp. MB02u-14 TaxID=2759815 RepID=UPI0015F5D1DE|nr:type II secretion system protein [Colwellia sp. MB02u-14]MBA6304728.1 type II secretion system protein [Colwellia sp. MB02u-14]